MKEDKHPVYQEVLFVDSSTGDKFVVGSTVKTEKRETYEGKEYPVVYISISSASHPFYNKDKKFLDTEGQVSKFMKRYARDGKESKK
jgi:large subunit ribosomal protein L31